MNALVQTKANGVPAIDRELVRRTVANGATNDELELYLYDCQRRNVHPLDKLLHFTKRGGRYVPVVSIDLMRSRAADTGQLAGSDDAVITAGNVGGPPLSASVTVYRLTQGQRFAYTGTARWSEYNAGGQMWQKMPHTMLSKCAEALALRKAFPQELAGLYTHDEMEQAGGSPVELVTEAKRENPHVNRASDIVDVPAADDPDRVPVATNAQELPKMQQRPIADKLGKMLAAFDDDAELVAWKDSPETSAMLMSIRHEWREIFQGRLKEKLTELRQKPKGDGPDAADPEGALKWIDTALTALTDPAELEPFWNERIAPCIDAMLPPDQEEALGLFRKHEQRLAP